MQSDSNNGDREPVGETCDGERTRRQEFYRTLLTCKSRRVEEANKAIVEAWQRCTGAAVVGLWQCNRFSSQFELTGLVVREGQNPFEQVPSLTKESVFYLVRKTKAPEYISDLRGWSKSYEGENYRVVYGKRLAEAGLNKALFVPVLDDAPDRLSNGSKHDDDRPFEGIVSLYYLESESCGYWPIPAIAREQSSGETRESLVLMGHLTALLLAKLRLRQQAEIGQQLANLAGKHLTRAKDDPRTVRYEYLEGILNVLEAELRIKAASIWWRHPFDETLTCLISKDGLVRSADNVKLVGRNAIADAEYNPDNWKTDPSTEAWTYRVFRTGDHLLWLPDAGQPRKPVYRDLVNGNLPEPSACLFMPIPVTGADVAADRESKAALGVIRCTQRAGVQFPNIPTPFDIVEVRLLEFIVEQIAPVLHSFQARIMREDAIRVIKHDMAASLSAMRDILDEIEGEFSQTNEAMRFNLQNMRECVFSNAGLTDRLARDVEDRIRPHPKKTDLGTQLLPRVKRLLTPYARGESQMHIHFDGFEDIPPLNVDPDLVERALYNLIVNAIKYGKRSSGIDILAYELEDVYAIDVSNDGRGVRDEDIPLLFRMYFRSTYAPGEGSGLGLPIVRQIMLGHEGKADLENARNPTTFRLSFPLTRAAVPRKKGKE